MTQSREQFEAHYDGWCNEGFQGYTESRRMGNSYKLPSIASAWAHWQASRDALVVTLPVARDSFGAYISDDCYCPDQLQSAFEAAGVKVSSTP